MQGRLPHLPGVWVIRFNKAARSTITTTSTADFDRGDKFKGYALLASLEEYVLIDQDRMQVECRRQIGKQQWENIIYSTGEQLTFKSIGLELPIEELYRGTSIA